MRSTNKEKEGPQGKKGTCITRRVRDEDEEEMRRGDLGGKGARTVRRVNLTKKFDDGDRPAPPFPTS